MKEFALSADASAGLEKTIVCYVGAETAAAPRANTSKNLNGQRQIPPHTLEQLTILVKKEFKMKPADSGCLLLTP